MPKKVDKGKPGKTCKTEQRLGKEPGGRNVADGSDARRREKEFKEAITGHAKNKAKFKID